MKSLIVLALILSVGAQAKEAKSKRNTASTGHRCESDAIERASKLLKLQVPGIDEKDIIVDSENIEVRKLGKHDTITITVIDGNVPYEARLQYKSDAEGCYAVSQNIRDLKDLK